MSDEKFAGAVLRAQEKFWESVTQDYPEAETGDFPPESQFAFDAACGIAVTRWRDANVKTDS